MKLKTLRLKLFTKSVEIIRVFLYFLHHSVVCHTGPVLFPLALVLGKCTEGEYAQGVMAGKAILSGAFLDVSNKAHRESFEGLRSDARTALDYIRFYQDTPTQRFRNMVATGETETQEFKSTLRFNIRAEKHDDEITHACVKTVAALLNSKGGQLVIGVGDDGNIVGIERDSFADSDRFQLHLMNALKNGLGEAAATSVSTDILVVENQSICIVTCSKSDTPVFCRFKGKEEQFFVRTGPGTTSLPVSQALAYVAKRFRKLTTVQEGEPK